MIVWQVIKEHFTWKDQIGRLAITDLKKTYSGAALGWSWAIIKPTVTIFIYWFAFSSGLRSRAGIEGFPFILWLLAGIVPWFYVSEILNQGTNAMRKYKHLITKMKFPVSTIPTFVSISKLLVHVILVAIVFVIYAVMGRLEQGVYFLQLPLYMFLMFLFCTGWAFFGSVIAAISKDFANLVRAFSMAFFWGGCIMFPLAGVHNKWMLLIIKLNPVTFTAEGYRNCFVHHRWFFESPHWLAVYLGELVIMWVLAFWAFKKLRKDMPDVL